MLRLVTLRTLESYFRHRWLYLLPVTILLVAAAFSLATTKPKFLAQGVIFVQRESLLAKLTSVTDPNVSWQTPASVTVGELNELLQTDAFIRAIIKQTDLEAGMNSGPDQVSELMDRVRKAVWVNALGNNQVRVSVLHERPQVSMQLATATIESFLQWKINADRTESEAARSFFSNLITSYKSDLDTARLKMDSYLEANPEPLKGDRSTSEQLQIKRLQSEIDLAETRYANALDKDEDARLASAQAESNVRQSYVLIDAPRLPDKSELSLKDLALQVAIFLVVGLILSGSGIVGGALLDRSLRFPVDVWHTVNLPVLAMVPDASLRAGRKVRKSRKKAPPAGEVNEAGLPMAQGVLPETTSTLASNEELSPEIMKIFQPLKTETEEVGASLPK